MAELNLIFSSPLHNNIAQKMRISMEKKQGEYKMLEVGRCENCGGLLRDSGLGIYICSQCGCETLSEFGKVKKYIEENGPSNAYNISQGTGVSVSKIDKFLRQGKIEIPEGSESYISCEMCGTDIRYGRYCPACATKLKKQLTSQVVSIEVGEIPKRKGKMRYMGEDADKRKGNKRKQ
jgi:predicted amidophosphoribosyltransferase